MNFPSSGPITHKLKLSGCQEDILDDKKLYKKKLLFLSKLDFKLNAMSKLFLMNLNQAVLRNMLLPH